MVILACGSRGWEERTLVRKALTQAVPEGVERREVTVLHGNARGADRIAGEVAEQLGMRVRVFPAHWARDGRRAGILRNLRMLDENPDLVLAFRVGETPGTSHTVAQARAVGIPVRIFDLRTGAPVPLSDRSGSE